MKKLALVLAIILVLSTLCALFVACTEEENPGNDNTTTTTTRKGELILHKTQIRQKRQEDFRQEKPASYKPQSHGQRKYSRREGRQTPNPGP